MLMDLIGAAYSSIAPIAEATWWNARVLATWVVMMAPHLWRRR